jgi:hypothetical protein
MQNQFVNNRFADESQVHEAFVKHHGGSPILDEANNRKWLLPSGAHFQETGAGFTRSEPQPGLAGLRQRRQYHALKLAAVEQDFHHLKRALLPGGIPWQWPARKYGPAPEPVRDGTVALKLLQKLVLESRSVLAEIDSEIANSPEEAARREAEALARRKLEQAQAREAEARFNLEDIKI